MSTEAVLVGPMATWLPERRREHAPALGADQVRHAPTLSEVDPAEAARVRRCGSIDVLVNLAEAAPDLPGTSLLRQLS